MNKVDYSQPLFYRFNSDSLQLVNFILKKECQFKSILDLGAGCGIIGIELAKALGPKVVTLVEMQEDYSVHIETNLKLFLPQAVESQVYYKSFGEWVPDQKYE